MLCVQGKWGNSRSSPTPLFCSRRRTLVWSLVFSLFGVKWVMPLLDGKGSVVRLDIAKFGRLFCYVLCGLFGEKGMFESLK